MKLFKLLLAFSVFLSLLGSIAASPATALGASNLLVLTKNSKSMVLNGTAFIGAQPLTIRNGVSYASFSSMAARYGYAVSYDAKTKESVARSASGEIRFRMNTKVVLVNGSKITGQAASFSLNGSMMVPIRTWAQATNSRVSASGVKVNLAWDTKPSAAFSVQPTKIYTGDPVTYVDKYSSPSGEPMVNEEWQGRQEVFLDPGTYTVTRSVQDASGAWSDPFTVTIEVLAPNQPPVADFRTDKEVYRQGERITFTSLSSDDATTNLKEYWIGKQDVFFEAGEKSITLEVTDEEGYASSITKTIRISDEVLYTREEYGKLFTAIGEMFPVDGKSVLSIPTLSYEFHSEPSKLVRSNSPELWTSEGIAYDDQFQGEIRLLFHNKNTSNIPLRMYLVATNEGWRTANFGVKHFGAGGPAQYEDTTGKMSTVRYMDSLLTNPQIKSTSIKPGQSKVVLSEISSSAIKTGMVYSAYADVTSDETLRFRVVVVADGKDPLKEVNRMELMPADGKHTRGSFNNATRAIDVPGVLGSKPERIVLGDNKLDPYLDGYDNTDGSLQLNKGNFGVLYKMNIQLSPRTLVALNPRGGLYTGAFIVNGSLIPVPTSGWLRSQNEAMVIYRSGNSRETLNLTYLIASGSNLPVTMIFQPLPAEKN
ncbi:copper amine oxidase N-terminal domain-containing protein [Paenibacillus herberti]|uniref:DNA-directed RNA polymerase subunit beta n=1 Tax=Paenibacillus herberti TaxID=1619309 RepID=A0A229P3W2_9BACL|nr:copper amine oxidase N-terminal domain-containing protein [Paenibacillus herberti]OXM16767.1 DNA-directed RNA polymerase subunit beta [Paenibacillus herberti]